MIYLHIIVICIIILFTVIKSIITIIGLLLFFDIRACAYWAFSSGSMAGTIFMYAIAGCALVWAGVLLYSFAVLSRYDDKAITIVKNSLILCVHHLPQTFIMMIATYGLILFSLKYFTAFIVTIPLIIYVDSFIFTRIFKSLENTNDERAREAEKEKAEKIETAKQHKAIDDNVDNTAVTSNDNQSDDSNN
jgi:uncharacterized membrane protein YesL